MTGEPPTVLRPGSGSYRHTVDVGEGADGVVLVVEATDDPDAPISLTVSLDWTTLRETTVSEEFFGGSHRAEDVATGAGLMAARLREDVDKADATDAIRNGIADVGSLLADGRVTVADEPAEKALSRTEAVEIDPDAGEVVVTLDEDLDPRELRIDRAQIRVSIDEWGRDDPPIYPPELVGMRDTSPLKGELSGRRWEHLRRAWEQMAEVGDALSREEYIAVSEPADVDRLASVGFPVSGAEFIEIVKSDEVSRLSHVVNHCRVTEPAARKIIRGLGLTDHLENVEPRGNQPAAD